ncbi:MAG: hypothetical protein ACREJN_02960 [Nitrospiraceae bacterium]
MTTHATVDDQDITRGLDEQVYWNVCAEREDSCTIMEGGKHVPVWEVIRNDYMSQADAEAALSEIRVD